MAEEMQQQVIEFERGRAQLFNISTQKQQLQLQLSTVQQAIEELEKTKEKRVFKAVGNIMVQADTVKVKKELVERKETIELRLKSVEKQEESLLNRLNKIKSTLEQSGQASPTSPAAETDVVFDSSKEGTEKS